jgi:hypothetical protein
MPKLSAFFDSNAILLATVISSASCGTAQPGARTPQTANAPQDSNVFSKSVSEDIEIYHETIESGGRTYVGGTAYLTIDEPTSVLVAALESDNAFWHVMPRVWDFRVISGDAQDKLVEIEQGTNLVRGRYTMRIQRQWDERDGSCKIGFTIDQRYPSAIRDAYGAFRVRPLGPKQSLIVYQIRIDLGPGLMRILFEDRILQAALSAPARLRGLMRSYAEGRTAQLDQATRGTGD